MIRDDEDDSSRFGRLKGGSFVALLRFMPNHGSLNALQWTFLQQKFVQCFVSSQTGRVRHVFMFLKIL